MIQQHYIYIFIFQKEDLCIYKIGLPQLFVDISSSLPFFSIRTEEHIINDALSMVYILHRESTIYVFDTENTTPKELKGLLMTCLIWEEFFSFQETADLF